MKMKFVCVITTIQTPTPSVLDLHKHLKKAGGRLIIAGDKQGPLSWDLPSSDFLSLSDQLSAGFSLAAVLPTGHYARKNIAYLEAIRRGATCIYETDDDNAPMKGWMPRQRHVSDIRRIASPMGQEADDTARWVNIYKLFTDELIWPRGLPLDAIHPPPPETSVRHQADAPIQQGLVNNSPDVDAIWRLTMDRPFEFKNNRSVYLEPGNWCPFNTQSTWWWPLAYPLMYIPSHCSFRMCDIWKSFIAQYCLWPMGLGVAFHSPEVAQERNPHDLMRDFNDEIPGYTLNHRFPEILSALRLSPSPADVAENLRQCYGALIEEAIFPTEEMPLVDAWINDVHRIAPPGC